MSGKGGVGKSLVTSSLVAAMRRMGKRVGILDADITGPSIPTAFNLHERATGTDGHQPLGLETGIEVMSLNLLVEGRPTRWSGGAPSSRAR